jgi:LacI family transcriptional regulator
MGKARVTMADVAERAGVSPTAVSLVMNDRTGTRISAEAVARVRAAAAELGYRPNLTARTLSTQRSEVIGFVSDLVASDRFATGLIRGALSEAKSQNHMLFIAETEGDSDAVEQIMDALLDRQVDGIIYAATRPHPLPVPIADSSVPVVMLNAVSNDGRPAVLPDEYTGGKTIVDLLLQAGHTNDIAIIGLGRSRPADEWTSVATERRLAGIYDALDEHHIVPIAEMPCQPWSARNGYEAVRELLAGDSHPRALICLNDRLAFGAYRALAERRLAVGEDVQVISFDDDDIAVYLEPQLTTAAAPYEQMGSLAVQLILGEEPPKGEYLVRPPIRVRASMSISPELRATFPLAQSSRPDWRI